MVELLEKRLASLDKTVIQDVKSAFEASHINPKKHWRSMPYLKSDLSNEVAKEIGVSDFSHNLYSVVNKDVLKRVYYGILSTGKIPEKFLKILTNWENVYLFRGRWTERHPDLDKSIDILTSEHLYLGLNKLHEDHYIRKADGQYISQKKFPESDRVRRDYKRIILRKERREKMESGEQPDFIGFNDLF